MWVKSGGNQHHGLLELRRAKFGNYGLYAVVRRFIASGILNVIRRSKPTFSAN
jgi:hypothetical protein